MHRWDTSPFAHAVGLGFPYCDRIGAVSSFPHHDIPAYRPTYSQPLLSVIGGHGKHREGGCGLGCGRPRFRMVGLRSLFFIVKCAFVGWSRPTFHFFFARTLYFIVGSLFSPRSQRSHRKCFIFSPTWRRAYRPTNHHHHCVCLFRSWSSSRLLFDTLCGGCCLGCGCQW